jgi:hypothetical protein
MVKRIIGGVIAVAAIAIVIFTVLGAGGYKSVLPEGWFSSSTPVEIETHFEAVQLDSVESWGDDEPADSLATAVSTDETVAVVK